MVFHSNTIEIEPDNTGRMTGDLTLLGITKPVILTFVKMPGKDKRLSNGYKITGVIKRSDFGMNGFIRPIGNVVTLLVYYNIE
jgi:polyisoprenoid-binding protein YceI